MNTKITLTRPPSRERCARRQTLDRRLSREETFQLADAAFRKSSLRETREDLRLRLGHSQMLELLLHELALSDSECSPPSSPPLSAVSSTPSASSKSLQPSSRKTQHKNTGSVDLGASSKASLPRQTARQPPHSSPRTVDEYGFAYDDDGEDEDDDLAGLSLCRTSSHRPSR